MKLPAASTLIRADAVTVFEFLANPKYLNLYPDWGGMKTERIEHLNSRSYGLGKQLRLHARHVGRDVSIDVEIYKYDPPNIIGFKYIDVDVGARRREMDRVQGYMPEIIFDLELKQAPAGTRLKLVPYVDNIHSGFLKTLFYLFVGVFGYYRNKRYIRRLGALIEKYA